MSLSRRRFLRRSAAAAAGLALLPALDTQANASAQAEVIDGPFQPSWDSLETYECPEWFRDAKFGIWAHWSAQCVPEQGDWYARGMYQEGSAQYEYHCKHYGHPSKFGFKDIDHIWKADKWEPEKLISLYKEAGARYFFALANHHDNFDCWDSTYQPWNSTRIGPMQNIVGKWAHAARSAGLKFGVSVHASHAWNWFEVAQGADTKGPYKGVKYDGVMTLADGKGLWWQGLDPNVQLYAQNHKPGVFSWQFTAPGCVKPDRAYITKFYNRVIDLIDKYHPDVLYFDDTVLPLYPVSDAGLRIMSYYYNQSIKRDGKVNVVLNGKGLNDQQRKCMVEDHERGRTQAIEPIPWQTDTCIGNWHYQLSLYENHAYKTPYQVARMLLDIVSKNGNLMLNIPLKGDGSPDPDEFLFLQGFTNWMKVNSEAIHDTRPWKIYGEGPGLPGSDNVHDTLTEKDFRFTTKGNTLYAAFFAWPTNMEVAIRALAANAPGIVGEVSHVSLLGSTREVDFKRTSDGLMVTLPQNPPCDYAWVLKIEGLDVAKSQPVIPALAPLQEINGKAVLTPQTAQLHGALQVEMRGLPDIGFWNSPSDYAEWHVNIASTGTWRIMAKASCPTGMPSITVSVGQASVTAAVAKTSDWSVYSDVDCGTVTVPSSGTLTVVVKSADAAHWQAINLAGITLTYEG